MLNLIGRENLLFTEDLSRRSSDLNKIVVESSFLVIGGAGSIGQAVVKEIFKRNPKKLHVVDINENSLTELVRDIRSSFGYIKGEFNTFALDIGSMEYDAFIKSDGKYDYVLNLSALKHVRSEQDPYTLMRMINVNIFNTDKTIKQSIKSKVKKYFCVSTDKAVNPENLMGASKHIMEMFLMLRSSNINISTARFANVVFSDGSLTCGFDNRINKIQPIAAPNDVLRYFLTPKESGELCLMSCIFGENRDIFFPKLNKKDLTSFKDVAINFLKEKGYEPFICQSENEARNLAKTLPSKGFWPCYFTQSDTTGEKMIEEFYTTEQIIDFEQYKTLGIIKNHKIKNIDNLKNFEDAMKKFKKKMIWDRNLIINEFFKLIPNLKYIDKKKFLNDKM